MARFRRQVSIARLLGAVLAVALIAALVVVWRLPWQAALVPAVATLLLIFVLEFTPLELVVVTVLAGVAMGLLLPAVGNHGQHNRRRRAVVGAPATPAPVVATPPG